MVGVWWEGVGCRGRPWAWFALSRGPSGQGLTAMPVRLLRMMLEKSSRGTVEPLKKVMFMRTKKRQKLVKVEMRRKAQAESSKTREGREVGSVG